MALGVCTECRRHVRGESCPFCGSSVAAPVARPRIGRTSRRGLALAAAAVAVACGGTTDGKDASSSDAQGDNISMAAYGLPFDAGPMPDAGTDAKADAPVAAYGGPPVDGGSG